MKGHSIIDRPDERGSALVGVLLLLMLISALAAALGVSGQTETLVARNHQSAAQAELAAEAGLNHAVEVASTYIFEWRANGFNNVDEALDALLASGGGVLAPDITLGTRIAIAGAINAEYEAYVMDEDDPNRDAATELLDDEDDENNEDGNPATDNNRTLIVRAVGYARDNTSVVLEAVIAPFPLPAIVTDGDLEISGNPTIDGTKGSIHANADLLLSGNPSVSDNVSASGTYEESGNPTIGGTISEGAAELPLPAVRANDYRFHADFILNAAGQMTLPDGVTVLCDEVGDPSSCKTAYGWEFSSPGWAISGNSASDGTFYVEGTAKISGSPGTSLDPLQISIIAEGSIEISGNPDLTPDTPELLFVTDGDLKISGGIDTPLIAQGQMLVHEQLQISGNPSLAGQLVVENAPSVDTLVEENKISGNPTITYNGGLGMGIFTVTGWREVR